MSKSFILPQSFTDKLAFSGSYGTSFSWPLGLLIETISSIQVLYLILATSFQSGEDEKTLIFHKVREVASIMSLFDLMDRSKIDLLSLIAWIVISCYTIIYLIFSLSIAWLTAKNISVSRTNSLIFTAINVFHSKVLFSPVYFFYLKFISLQKQCPSTPQSQPFTCENSLTVLSIVFLLINLFFAVLKETLFYQVYKNRNTFSVKTNYHSIIQLSHKALFLPLLISIEPNIIANSILNVIFTLAYHILLFLKFPYHNTRCLRFTVFLSSICSTSSFVLLWKIIGKPRIKTFELLVILITPVMTKFMLDRLNDLFERILILKAKNPDHIVYLPALVKENIFCPSGIDYSRKIRYKRLYTFGIVKMNNLDVAAMQDSSQLNSYKQKIYNIILEQMLKSYHRNPKSVTILLFLVQFYMGKMKNISLAVGYMEKIQALPLSSPTVNALVYVRNKLAQILFKAYSDYDKSFSFVSYFKYKEISNRLKNSIQAEVKEHIEFWKILSKEKVDVFKALHISKSLDILALKNQKAWQEHEVDFRTNFPVPLIIYGIYLSVVRGLPYHGESVLDRSVGKNLKLMKSMEDWFSQERALIVASNQKGSIGKVLDASYSVKNVFNIEKQDLIGRKINMLMPNMIQEKHDQIIQRYNQKPTCDLDLNKLVYSKTVDGQFFHANFQLRVYPYIDKGIGLIGIINKKENYIPMFFLDIDGSITDCSRELLNISSVDFFTSQKIKIQELAPEFDRINAAFNQIYMPQILSLISLPSHTGNDNQQDPGFLTNPIKHTYQETHKTSAAFETTPLALDIQSSNRRLILFENTSSKNSENVIPQPIPIPRERLNSNNDYLSNAEDSHPISSQQEPKLFPSFPRLQVTPTGYFEPSYRTRFQSSQDEYSVVKSQSGSGMEINEAKKICERFEKGSVTLFRFPQGSKFYTDSFEYFFVRVEPLFFEQKLYKAVRIKPIRKTGTINIGTPKWMSQANKRSQLEVMNPEGEYLTSQGAIRSEDSPAIRSKRIIDSEIESLGPRKAFQHILSVSNQSVEPNHVEQGVEHEFIKEKNNQASQEERNERIEKALYDVYQKENTSAFMKAYKGLFYFGMILMTVIVVIDYISTRNSFKQVWLSAKLVSLNCERITNLVNVWGSTITIYSFVARGTPVPASLVYFDYIKQLIERSYQISGELMSLIPLIDSKEVYEEFFRKNVYFWDPTNPGHLVSSSPFTTFEGSNLVLQNQAMINADKFGSLELDPLLAIYGLNNTVNSLLLSSEKELQVTQGFKKNVYSGNILLLKALISIQSGSIFVVLFNLVFLYIKIIKAFKRLFRCLSTIPSHNIEIREKQLTLFRDFLQESVESLKFIQDVNTFYEHVNQRKKKNVKGVAFKEESKFLYGRMKSRNAIYLLIALLFFMMTFGTFYLSNVFSSQSNTRLQRLDESSQIAQIVRYQIILLSGSFLSYANFYNQSNILMRNEPLEEQLSKNLQYFSNINNLIIDTFTNEQGEFTHPDIKSMLMEDVCSFLETTEGIQELCHTVTQGKLLGLLGVNKQGYELISNFIELFRSNPYSQDTGKLIHEYLFKSLPFIVISDRVYKYLKTRLMSNFIKEVEDQDITSTIMFILSCVACVIVAIGVRLFVINQFKILEKLRYKVLKLIPQNMIIENKIILSYLQREFQRDLSDIKSIL